MKKIFTLLVFFFAFSLSAQTKVSGIVLDNTNQPIPYANIVFKGSQVGVVSNEDGRFYIESPNNYTAIIVSFVGFPDKGYDKNDRRRVLKNRLPAIVLPANHAGWGS